METTWIEAKLSFGRKSASCSACATQERAKERCSVTQKGFFNKCNFWAQKQMKPANISALKALWTCSVH